jgi:hypothetical protein
MPLPVRCHRLTALLAGLVVLAAPTSAVHADALVSGLAGDVRPGTAYPAGDLGSPVAFRTGPRRDEEETNDGSAEIDPDQVLQLLAALLAVPAGCTPTYTHNSSNTTNATTTPQNNPHISSNTPPDGSPGPGGGDLAPEPGSLASAVIGGVLVGLDVLRRRRRLRLAC